jgi:tRNA(Ile)-lysidine synthase
VVSERVLEAVRAGGLLGRPEPLVAMLSGGRDSTCLLDLAVAIRPAGGVRALHVNYGLRAQADAEQEHCAALCARLGVALEVVRAGADAPAMPAPAWTQCAQDPAPSEAPPATAGNLQAWARELRYRAAAELAAADGALIATGHTASDQVETILYRLAASPGRRALLGMAPEEGGVLRPLLVITREQTAAYCSERGLQWIEDASNDDRRFARARVRGDLLPALRAVHPAAESNVLRTALLLREETELLEELVCAELGRESSVTVARLGELPAALARLVLVRLAEQAVGTYVPQAGERVQEILALGGRGGRAELHVGGGACAVIERGIVRMVRLPPRAAGADGD